MGLSNGDVTNLALVLVHGVLDVLLRVEIARAPAARSQVRVAHCLFIFYFFNIYPRLFTPEGFLQPAFF